MAGNNAAETLVAGTGKVMVAPLATTAPVDLVTAYAAGWIDLGYTTAAGVTINPEWESEELDAWQSFEPIRRLRTGRSTTLGFTLRQWNAYNLPFAMGGGTMSTLSAGVFKYVPPAAGVRDERSLSVEWVDGADKSRLIVPLGEVSSLGEINLTRTDGSNLEVEFAALGSGTADPFHILSSDTAWTPA